MFSFHLACHTLFKPTMFLFQLFSNITQLKDKFPVVMHSTCQISYLEWDFFFFFFELFLWLESSFLDLGDLDLFFFFDFDLPGDLDLDLCFELRPLDLDLDLCLELREGDLENRPRVSIYRGGGGGNRAGDL